MGLAQVLHDFANWSTVCGVPHIANARTKAWRIFWSVVFIGMVSMFIYQLYTMIVKFISFPTNVNTEIFFEEQDFPVVTVCNSNPYKYSVIANDSNLASIVNLMEVYKEAVTKSLASDDAYGFFEIMNTESEGNVSSNEYQIDQLAWEALALEAAQLGEQQLAPALYTFEDLITDCTFSGKKCSAADFTRVYDPIYGACYSFNEDASLRYSTNRAGMKFGLKLLITVSQYTTSLEKDFLPTTKMAGARVSIQPRGIHPALDNNGINVGVGHQTAISLTSTRTRRMKEPYGKCVDNDPTGTSPYKTGYTLETCFYNCRQRETMKQCNCANPRFKKFDSQQWCLPRKTDSANAQTQMQFENQNFPVKCLKSLRGDQSSATPNICPLNDCSCGPPCSEISYLTTASILKFPAEGYFVATNPMQGVAGSCDNQNPTFNKDQRKCRDWYAENALLLQVFFETLKYESYTEVPNYGISAVLNDLGGQAGLWLGFSVISVIEVCALIIMLGLFCVTCGKLKVRPDDGELEEDERIKDVEEVKKELDEADKHDKIMNDDESDDDDDFDDGIRDNNNEKQPKP
ncbi:hypothetical protein GCK32_001656 [Trichostrongylus colubriformis]|uniref:Uncharacterized protein n=1 Tax=Trichostrongylus colubriformis TaxID=6319 RepID=A0AAN8FSI1_TRICO